MAQTVTLDDQDHWSAIAYAKLCDEMRSQNITLDKPDDIAGRQRAIGCFVDRLGRTITVTITRMVHPHPFVRATFSADNTILSALLVQSAHDWSWDHQPGYERPWDKSSSISLALHRTSVYLQHLKAGL